MKHLVSEPIKNDSGVLIGWKYPSMPPGAVEMVDSLNLVDTQFPDMPLSERRKLKWQIVEDWKAIDIDVAAYGHWWVREQ